jgi:hypothetical protein
VKGGSVESRVALGVLHGAAAQHALLFDAGCFFENRTPPNCTDGDHPFPYAVASGLDFLIDFVVTLLRKMLQEHATPPSETTPLSAFEILRGRSPEVDFLLRSFDGHLDRGMERGITLVLEETSSTFEVIHYELRILYGVFVGYLLFFFFGVFFQNTIRSVRAEADRARVFVQTMPLRAVTDEAAERMVQAVFAGGDEDDLSVR